MLNRIMKDTLTKVGVIFTGAATTATLISFLLSSTNRKIQQAQSILALRRVEQNEDLQIRLD